MLDTTRNTRAMGALAHWLAVVSEAAEAYERRWTLAALRRVEPGLHARLLAQRDLFRSAQEEGSAADIERFGGGMVRGWAAAIARMEAAGEPDDAYLMGQDPKTGFRVAVGLNKAAAERVAELYGDQVAWISPDELAALLGGCEILRELVLAKRRFPGAEVVEVRPRYSAEGEDLHPEDPPYEVAYAS